MVIDIILLISTYFTTLLFIIVNLVSIYHVYKTKNSIGVSKLSFWLILTCFCILDIYSIYYRIIELIVSYTVQAILVSIYIFVLYKYSSPNLVPVGSISHIDIDIEEICNRNIVLIEL